jgi:hypothetical protein
MSEEAEKKKDEVLKLINDVDARATRLEGLAQDVVESARRLLDTVKPYRSLISELPAVSHTSSQWDHAINMLRGVQASVREIELSALSVSALRAQSFGMSSTSNTTISIVRDGRVPLTPTIKLAISQLNEAMERSPLADTALSSLRRLGLDRRAGDARSPLELLEDAKAALDRPSRPDGSPASVLILLRECILAAVAEMLRRRPVQEPTRGTRDKLTSLGQHCARQGLKTDHFERLATNMDSVVNELSGAKQAQMSRQWVSELFNQGLTLLNALLESIDETLLR